MRSLINFLGNLWLMLSSSFSFSAATLGVIMQHLTISSNKYKMPLTVTLWLIALFLNCLSPSQ